MFRKFLEPKIDKRIRSLNELHKFLDERWLARSAEKEMAGKIQSTVVELFFFFHFKFSFPSQNTSPTSSIHRFTHFTAISMKKINYCTLSHSKALKRLLTE